MGPTAMSMNMCTNTPDYIDCNGNGCGWYETNDRDGCPAFGNSFIGRMGVSSDNFCYCKGQRALPGCFFLAYLMVHL